MSRSPEDDPDSEPPGAELVIPDDVDEADILEQAAPVPEGEEEDYPHG
ncbi:hypothetical protein LWF01_06385 [Saxibacter everestensis]|uniref:Uncharacterized protein n=1 Tax=Saxibacter everestensis TaxID=2909229 RepID=A0ABY8QX48_9MICO|nr:hypothetical protein LWF01_06385 [Brevibacteriaceae bacterium ZFBP1038]